MTKIDNIELSEDDEELAREMGLDEWLEDTENEQKNILKKFNKKTNPLFSLSTKQWKI